MDDKIKKPSECSEEEIENFYQLVIEGDQVDIYGLRDRIKRAALLAFHYEGSTLAGIVAVKRPYEVYKEKVFQKAGVSQKTNEYNLEMGWAFTISEYREKNICSGLTRKLVSEFKSQNIFATVRTDNLATQKILARNGFEKIGEPYPGRQNKHKVQLLALHRK